MLNYIKDSEYNLSDVYPNLSINEVKTFLDEYKTKSTDVDKVKSIDDLSDEIKKLLKQVYISKSINSKSAIKARFNHIYPYMDLFNQKDILFNDFSESGCHIDLIVENIDEDYLEAYFFIDILDKKQLSEVRKSIEIYNDFIKSSGKKKKDYKYLEKIKHIFLICGRIDRTISNELEQLNNDNSDFNINLYLEYEDPNKDFNDNDLIIINDLEIKGFNFGSIEEILSLVKRELGEGRYSIFAEDLRGFKKIIWEGYIFPKKIF